MNTIEEIRRHNLLLLLREIESELGRTRGAISHLARLSDVTKQQIGQVIKGDTHNNGAPRVLGSDSARALERAMNRPEGWMDKDHTLASTVKEADFLDALRECSPEDQATVLDLLNSLRKRGV